MSDNPLADQVWQALSTLVLDNKDGWRRAVVERTGLPFSRIRILKRLARQPMTVKQVAEATTIAVLDDTEDPAPGPLAALDAADLQALQAILTRVVS